MQTYKIPLVPGPVSVPRKYREAYLTDYGSSDLEKDFYALLGENQELLQQILKTKNEVTIQSGEAMLILWGALKSTVKAKDRVLVLSNGIFGRGFGEMAETLGAEQSAIGRIYRTVYQRCKAQRQLVIDKFPKLNRFLTGYDLRHVFNDEMSEFDLTRILTGSEGTLAFITEARLDITRLPKVRRLVNVKYDSFDSALRNAPFMVQAQALSVETVDSKVLNLAREDIVWHSVSDLITDVPDKEMLGLNIVEFAGDDAELIERADCIRRNGSARRDGRHRRFGQDGWATFRIILHRPVTIDQAQQIKRLLLSVGRNCVHLVALDFSRATLMYDGTARHSGAYTHGVVADQLN